MRISYHHVLLGMVAHSIAISLLLDHTGLGFVHAFTVSQPSSSCKRFESRSSSFSLTSACAKQEHAAKRHPFLCSSASTTHLHSMTQAEALTEDEEDLAPLHSTTQAEALTEDEEALVKDILFEEEQELEHELELEEQGKPSSRGGWTKNARWESLNPRIKASIIRAAHERAIANRKKREPIAVKKRRLLWMYRAAQLRQKQDNKVKRPIPFEKRSLTLDDITVNMELNGTVISLTKFGAYIDVGTEIDGLLHVSQISRDYFVEHPRQALTPGQDVTVRVTSVSPEFRKLQFSMLPQSEDKDDDDDEEEEELIPFDDLALDDELWGELKRITDYGAYVELGAVVDGFLHFMDHPQFGVVPGAHPSTYMKKGDRVRVWVYDLDEEKNRIKLTANRPQDLPGPRREIHRRTSSRTRDKSSY